MNESTEAALRDGTPPYRRRYVRVRVDFPVTYVRENSDIVVHGRSNDLGGGGIRLATDDDLPLGEMLLLRFRLSELEREMVARGRIVLSFFNAESKLFHHGIAFTQIDPRDQEDIIKYVAAEVQRLAESERASD